MDFNLKLTGDQINVILRLLDQGPHNQVRGVIDDIIGQVQRQEVDARQAQATPEPAPVVE